MKWRFNLGMLAIGAVLFASCSSNDDLFDPEKAAQRREAQYTTAFAKLYGKIAPDQAWGFGETAETRTANTNSNQWEDYTVVPGVITIEELEAVTTHFSQKLSPESSVKVDWTDFFVQHVYSGHSNMDYLVAANDDHINNFNATNGSIMLMVNSGTSSFGYYNSLDSKMHYEYIIQEINGSYYVGFDFYANGTNSNQQEEADGIYNDWIVKISPAVYKNAKRIIAEDLGDTNDFDFNDVVFDAALLSDATVITLQAAGGTLPLYIGTTEPEHEVHNLFNVPETTMVNTGDGAERPVVVFRLPRYNSIDDIAIVVGNTSAVRLKADCGAAPQKICVETRYKWTAERQRISDKYPEFENWVKDPGYSWY